MRLIDLIRRLRRRLRGYEPLVLVALSRSALLHNLQTFREAYPGVAVAPVIKSNAYGHGLLEVAGILDKENIPFFVVDSVFEALALRKAGLKSKILILGYTPPRTILRNRLKNVSFGIINLEQLKKISQSAHGRTNIHLKIDTGMHRQGLAEKELDEAFSILKNDKNIFLEGISSHLADAENADDAFTKGQISAWNALVRRTKQEFPDCRWFHLAATPGSRFSKDIEANALRLGFGLYGLNPKGLDLPLRPVLEMRSRITSIREIEAGETVGYDRTFRAEKKTLVATIPAGYFEGIDRRLSNRGTLTVRGIPCPIAGRVSMNITSIDVTDVPGVSLGEEVLIISRDPEAPNAARKMAELCGTIPYDIFVHIPAHLRREVTE